MAASYSTALKTTRMTAVLNAIDFGGSAGTLEIGTGSMASVLVTIPLNYPCGTVSTDTLTFDTTPYPTGTVGIAGTLVEARIKDSSGTVVVSGLTVGISSANIIVTGVGVGVGDIVQMLSGSIQHG